MVSIDLSNYATRSWVEQKGYLNTVSKADVDAAIGVYNSGAEGKYYSEKGTWVAVPTGYYTFTAPLNETSGVVSIDLSAYATQQWVLNKQYATQTWVSAQGYLD